jgi:hypothetical protein
MYILIIILMLKYILIFSPSFSVFWVENDNRKQNIINSIFPEILFTVIIRKAARISLKLGMWISAVYKKKSLKVSIITSPSFNLHLVA